MVMKCIHTKYNKHCCLPSGFISSVITSCVCCTSKWLTMYGTVGTISRADTCCWRLADCCYCFNTGVNGSKVIVPQELAVFGFPLFLPAHTHTHTHTHTCLQPIISFCRCKPGSKFRPIFNVIHGNIIGWGVIILACECAEGLRGWGAVTVSQSVVNGQTQYVTEFGMCHFVWSHSCDGMLFLIIFMSMVNAYVKVAVGIGVFKLISCFLSLA